MPNIFKNDEQRLRWNAYNKEYSRRNYKSISIKLNYVTDADIIEALTGDGRSPTEVIKTLVRNKNASK